MNNLYKPNEPRALTCEESRIAQNVARQIILEHFFETTNSIIGILSALANDMNNSWIFFMPESRAAVSEVEDTIECLSQAQSMLESTAAKLAYDTSKDLTQAKNRLHGLGLLWEENEVMDAVKKYDNPEEW